MPQIQISKQPVTQITIIEAEREKQAEALAIMTERARIMARVARPPAIRQRPRSCRASAPGRQNRTIRQEFGRCARQPDRRVACFYVALFVDQPARHA